MNLIETLRGHQVSALLERMTEVWPKRREVLRQGFRNPASPEREEVIQLAERLASSFRLEGLAGRDQSQLANAGTHWQALVAYYLNLCFAGTEAIALSRSFVPTSIERAMRIGYRHNPAAVLSPDIDLLVVFAGGIAQVQPHKYTSGRTFSEKQDYGEYVRKHFGNTTAVLVQTKTNWNDNAQVPMLWNFVYSLAFKSEIPADGYSVGTEGFHISDLKSFAYAFVTVPSNDVDGFNPTSMPVARVAGMTGGAYWGHPTKRNVMKSLSEFFNVNFDRARGNFPTLPTIGLGYANEIKRRVGSVDAKSFDLL